MTEQPVRRREWLAVLAGCAAASLAAAAWSWRHGAMLNYGDAVAHLHIARRVIDSRRPGLSQLGSVWLPLAASADDSVRRSLCLVGQRDRGPDSIGARVAGRLRRHLPAGAPLASAAASALALAFFALNPNLLYMQTTAMTEPLFVCEMIWTAVWLVEWRSCLDYTNDAATNRHRADQLLYAIAVVLVAAIFTRYDGWIMALPRLDRDRVTFWRGAGSLRSRAFWLVSALVIAAAPIVWFAYNAVGLRRLARLHARPLFGQGHRDPHRDTGHGSAASGLAQSVGLAAVLCQGRGDGRGRRRAGATWLLTLSVLGTAWAWLIARRRAFLWALLLWLPVPFYAYSVAYGSVPIFLPRLVAALLVQHALRTGTASGVCAGPGLLRALCAGRGPRIQAGMDKVTWWLDWLPSSS